VPWLRSLSQEDLEEKVSRILTGSPVLVEWIARQDEETMEAYDNSRDMAQVTKIQGKRAILFALLDMPQEVANREQATQAHGQDD